MQKEIFNIQLTKEEIKELIEVLGNSIEWDVQNEHPAQQSQMNLKQYLEKALENKRLEDESPF